MASIKTKFKPSALDNHEGTIYHQIIHNRRVKQLFTKYHIFRTEWDDNRSALKINSTNERTTYLQSVRERIRWDVEQLIKISQKYEDCGMAYSTEDIVEEFERYQHKCSFFNFMENVITNLRQLGKLRTSETYKAALLSFRKYRKNEDVLLHEITFAMMDAYEGWLHNAGVAANTVSFYMRILRATYNRAVDEGLIEDKRPFRHVYTGVDKTIKRALPIQAIKKMRCLDLTQMPKLDYARDMFLLSFMLRGMSFVDMAYLKKSDLSNGCVSYRRRKTGQLLRIEWTSDMQLILNKYPHNKSDYLLPIITEHTINERKVYRNTNSKVNYALKRISRMIGISCPLTLYVARHSWASAAKANGIPLRVISEGMGHDSEKTTRIYLSSLDTSVVNKANKLILSLI